MKKVFSIAVGFVLAIYALGQVQLDKLSIPPKVIVTNWSQSIFLLPANYWNDGKKGPEIISQLGEDGFEHVKKFSDARNIPCEFLIFCEDRDGSPKKDLDSLAARKSQLNVFRVATYKHHSKDGNIYSMAILSVPYEQNKSWSRQGAKWDTIYFLVDNNLVKEAK